MNNFQLPLRVIDFGLQLAHPGPIFGLAGFLPLHKKVYQPILLLDQERTFFWGEHGAVLHLLYDYVHLPYYPNSGEHPPFPPDHSRWGAAAGLGRNSNAYSAAIGGRPR